MAESNINNFNLACSNLIKSTIVAPIVQYLINKGINVTVDELVTHLQLPAPRMSPLISSISPINQYASTGGTAIVAPSTTTTRGKVIASSVIEPGKCEYRFQRGEHKNKYCSKPVEPGTIYCRTCLKNRKGLDGSKSGAKNVVASSIGDEPFVNAPQDHMTIDAKPYDISKGLYIETLHNIIIHAQGENLVAIGCLIDGAVTKIPPLARKYLETIKIPIIEKEENAEDDDSRESSDSEDEQITAPPAITTPVVPMVSSVIQQVSPMIPTPQRRLPLIPTIPSITR